MRLVSSTLALLLLATACDDTPAVNTTPSSAIDTSPVVTAISTDFEQTWDPAWAPPPDLLIGVEAALSDNGISALVPTGPPPTGPSLSADLRITRTMPTDRPAMSIVLRRADLSVYASLQAAPIGTQPACETRLDDLGYPAWATHIIRGTTGCSLLVEGAVSSLDWSEAGQYFHAEFGPEVDVDELVSWLDTWLPVGSG
ncbi:MAG: hypothetical protein MUP76_05825 [Acidimicrobiia bacterium]|nr:hypothetical protein [Acidimicrobiia bacterium]